MTEECPECGGRAEVNRFKESLTCLENEIMVKIEDEKE